MIVSCLACQTNNYLDTKTTDPHVDKNEIYGSYSSHDRYTSGQYTFFSSDRYVLDYHNCFGFGQEVGKVEIDGRYVCLKADSTWMSQIGKLNDTTWKSYNEVRKFYYKDGALYHSAGNNKFNNFPELRKSR